jgi:lipooligosaccharide transport system permease protein
MALLHWKRGIAPIYIKVLRQEMQSWVNETLTTMSIPLTFFLTFGLGLRGYISNVDGVPYLAFIAPGLISLAILLEAYRTGAWGLWLDRWHQKMLDEYRIKPITTSDIIIGDILGGFTVALIKGAIVAAILLLMSPFRLDVSHLGAYLLYLFPGSILFTCVGTMVGTVFKKPDQVGQVQNIIITPLLYLGGLFFPIKAFPAWLQPIIHWLPTTALFDGGRAALLTGAYRLDYGLSLWAVALLSFWGATALFNHKLSE